MAGEDFDLEGLAAFLELDQPRVRRMADHGEIPGRRVGGAWRFSREEIHQWLHERLIEADQDERLRIEQLMARDASATEIRRLTLEALLPLEAMAVPLAARTRASVISSMVDTAMETGLLWDPDRMTEAVREREEMHPTAIEGGVALLHPRRPLSNILGAHFMAYGRTEAGIPFGDPDGRLTDIFFLIMSMDDRGHLRTLARLGRLLRDQGVLEQLRACPDAHSTRELLITQDEELD